jgi:hypothetical protein
MGMFWIDNIQALSSFIDLPSQKYQPILTIVLEIETQIPSTPYKLPGGDYLADSNTIIEMFFALKYIKDMVKIVLNSSIMGLVDDIRGYDIRQYNTYSGMMVRNGRLWLENIKRYLQNVKILSQYVSIDADTMIDAQDETFTLNSTPDHPIHAKGSMITRQPSTLRSTHPEAISIGSNRGHHDLVTPNIGTRTNMNTLIERNPVLSSGATNLLLFDRTATPGTEYPRQRTTNVGQPNDGCVI